MSSVLPRSFSPLLFLALLFSPSAFPDELAWGPRIYLMPETNARSEPIIYEFPADLEYCDGRLQFFIVLQNGNGEPDSEITNGSAVLNGVEVLSENDFKRKVTRVEQPVDLLAENTLEVTLKEGKRGATATVFIIRRIEESVFGPRTYTITAGQLSATETISVDDPGSHFAVTVRNGATDGSRRVNSGEVRLNGSIVISSNELNSAAAYVRKNTTLTSSNTLQLEISGSEGDYVIVEVRRKADESICGPTLQMTSPAAGETVTTSTVLVSGTFSGSRDAGVVVNGISAGLDHTHAGTATDPFQWMVAIPVEIGPVTLLARVEDARGRFAEISRPITFSPGAVQLKVSADRTNDIVPFETAFLISDPLLEQVTGFEADFNGDGFADLTQAEIPESLQFTYETPGIYAASFRAFSGNAIVAEQFVTIQAQTVDSIVKILDQRFHQFRSALMQSDPAAAGLHITEESRGRYVDVFTKLQSRLPAIAAQMVDLYAIHILGDIAAFLLIRQENGSEFGYEMFLIRDEKGIWRISQF